MLLLAWVLNSIFLTCSFVKFYFIVIAIFFLIKWFIVDLALRFCACSFLRRCDTNCWHFLFPFLNFGSVILKLVSVHDYAYNSEMILDGLGFVLSVSPIPNDSRVRKLFQKLFQRTQTGLKYQKLYPINFWTKKLKERKKLSQKRILRNESYESCLILLLGNWITMSLLARIIG